jgi:hypothetical protein
VAPSGAETGCARCGNARLLRARNRRHCAKCERNRHPRKVSRPDHPIPHILVTWGLVQFSCRPAGMRQPLVCGGYDCERRQCEASPFADSEMSSRQPRRANRRSADGDNMRAEVAPQFIAQPHNDRPTGVVRQSLPGRCFATGTSAATGSAVNGTFSGPPPEPGYCCAASRKRRPR